MDLLQFLKNIIDNTVLVVTMSDSRYVLFEEAKKLPLEDQEWLVARLSVLIPPTPYPIARVKRRTMHGKTVVKCSYCDSPAMDAMFINSCMAPECWNTVCEQCNKWCDDYNRCAECIKPYHKRNTCPIPKCDGATHFLNASIYCTKCDFREHLSPECAHVDCTVLSSVCDIPCNQYIHLHDGKKICVVCNKHPDALTKSAQRTPVQKQ